MKFSQLRPYSFGIVADNKSLSSKEIEVTPVEDLTMLDGEINSDKTTESVSSEDADGKAYEIKLQSKNSITASWLPMGSSNRLTAPDVRRGAEVMIYRFGDSDKYFWATLKDDMHLRKLETVVYAWSATKTEDAPVSSDNYYYLEVSTHKGLVHFSTSKANGEPYSYDIQINTKEGAIIIQDDIGHKFVLDSGERQIVMENPDGTSIEINKQNMTLTVVDTYTLKAKKVVEEIGETMSTKAGTSITTETANHTTKANSLKEQATTVEIDGSATVMITGSAVSIN